MIVTFNKRYVIIEAVDNNLSTWILSQLDERGWSQSELARRSGLTRTTISKIISEQSSLGIDSMTGLAKAFRLPVTEILQQAGLIPKIPEATAKEEQILFMFRQMTPEQQQDVIDYADFISNR